MKIFSYSGPNYGLDELEFNENEEVLVFISEEAVEVLAPMPEAGAQAMEPTVPLIMIALTEQSEYVPGY